MTCHPSPDFETALTVIATASPIQKRITSLNHLKGIGVTIETRESVDGSGISIQVSWKPAANDDDAFPARMDLMLFSKVPADPAIHARTRLQVRFTQLVDGVMTADFTITPAELEDTQLWFRESQQVNHCLNLHDLVKGFPDLDRDPFADK